MYSCSEVIAELSAFLDDEVAEEVQRQIQAHIGTCHTCEALYDSARKTLRIVSDAGSFDVPLDLSQKIIDRIRSRGSKGPA